MKELKVYACTSLTLTLDIWNSEIQHLLTIPQFYHNMLIKTCIIPRSVSCLGVQNLASIFSPS